MNLTEKKVSGKTVYDGKILKLEVDEVILPDGSASKRECVRHCGGVAVLYVEKGAVLLVRQFRYLYNKALWEIPAGKVENGEDAAYAAKREFEEETGYIDGQIKPLLTLYPTPGYTDEIIRIYQAENCVRAESRPDEGEFLEVGFIEIEKVLQMIERGEICDAKTVAAVYKYLNDINKK